MHRGAPDPRNPHENGHSIPRSYRIEQTPECYRAWRQAGRTGRQVGLAARSSFLVLLLLLVFDGVCVRRSDEQLPAVGERHNTAVGAIRAVLRLIALDENFDAGR